jgi:transcription antitermination factor NusG
MLDEVFALANQIAATRPRYLWHVALTHPGQDRQAAEGLRRRKYRVYWPNFPARLRLRSGSRRSVERSIFPGYLFVLPSRDGWEPLRESPGIRGLMRIGEQLAVLWDDDPDFRRIEQAEARLRNPQESPRFTLSQRVKITKGPFIELWGNIEALDESGRVDVLIELLKRKVRVTCSSDQLNPA